MTEWISVKDELPPESEAVLCLVVPAKPYFLKEISANLIKTHCHRVLTYCKIFGGSELVFVDQYYNIFSPTHWTRLPELPGD